MNVNRDIVRNIYEKLGDDLSKEVFKNRLMYSLTHDCKWIYENLKTTEEGKKLIDKLNQCKQAGEEFVIFGAGFYGKILYKIFQEYSWKCFIDNYPKTTRCEGLPLLKATDFLKNYNGEYIFIFSKTFCEEIFKQLCEAGVSQEKIINIYELTDSLSQKEYFDLEYMEPSKDKEIFVDCGCFDGTTSIRFSEWCNGNGHVYAFEPDKINYIRCKENFDKHNVSYNLISKGVWKEEDALGFSENANMGSAIVKEGDTTVEVISLDKTLKDAGVTFIKMDIEGSELNALIGAKSIIENDQPKLAICVYHKDEDIVEIPELILNFNPEYKLYLRHYSLVNFETVLYAI